MKRANVISMVLLVALFVLGVGMTISNAEVTSEDDANVNSKEVIQEEIAVEHDAESVEIEEEDAVISDDEYTENSGEEFIEIYLSEDDTYVFTAVCDTESNDWFLYETCKHCDLAACSDTTPSEIYDRFGVKVE